MIKVTLVLALALSMLLSAAIAGTPVDDMDQAADQADSESAAPARINRTDASEEDLVMPATPSEVVLEDPTTRQQYLTAMQRYYAYKVNGYNYRSRVFEWQLLSSRVIFIVVLALVGAGLYFAAVQFRLAMRAAASKAASVKPDAVDANTSLATKLELSAKGVVVNSSVLGVIILALSLAFFYLYLVHVYPIKNVF